MGDQSSDAVPLPPRRPPDTSLPSRRPSGFGVLPPREKATRKEENEAKIVIMKDIEGFSHRPIEPSSDTFEPATPRSNVTPQKKAEQPWIPIVDRDNSGVSKLLSEPISIANQTVILSADGFAKDSSEPMANIKINRLADYAEKRTNVNELVHNKQEHGYQKPIDEFKPAIQTKDEYKIQQPTQYSYNRDLINDQKGRVEIKPEPSQTAKYTTETRIGLDGKIGGKGSLYGNENAGLFNYEGSASAFGGVKNDDKGTVAGFSLGAGGSASVAHAGGSFGKDSLVGGGGDVSVLNASAKAQADAYIGMQDGKLVGRAGVELGGELNAAKGTVNGKAALTPARGWNFLVAPIVTAEDWMGWKRHIDYLDKKWDWGIWCAAEGSAQIGIGAKAEAKIQTDPPSFKVGASATAGVGAGLGLSCGPQTPYY